MHVGLFGGSFDPVHHGHLLVGQSVAEALALDELRFLPAREQPFKVGRHAAPPEARSRMLALAIQGEPRFRLERVELDRPGPSYTVDTLRLLREREPAHRFNLLVGADAARELPSWREAETLPDLADLVLFARAGAVRVQRGRVREEVRRPVLEALLERQHHEGAVGGAMAVEEAEEPRPLAVGQ